MIPKTLHRSTPPGRLGLTHLGHADSNEKVGGSRNESRIEHGWRKGRIMKRLALGLIMMVLFVSSPAFAQDKTFRRVLPGSGEVIEVIDGDTVVVRVKGEEKKVELNGIDAPELGQPYGKEAASALSKMVLGKKHVSIQSVVRAKTTRDSIGFIQGPLRTTVTKQEGVILRVTGKYANAELVKMGLAWQADKKYERLEKAARQSKTGLWADDNPVKPVEWRQREIEKRNKERWLAKVKSFRPNGVNEIVKTENGAQTLYIYRPREKPVVTVPIRGLNRVVQNSLNRNAHYLERKKLAEATGKYDRVIIVEF